MFIVDDRFIGVFNIAGEFFALNDHCPHAGASLAHGIIHGDTVSCRMHYWQFCIRTGAYLDEVKPQVNVKTYPVRVVGEQVQVGI